MVERLVSPDEVPRRIQYVNIDSEYYPTNNTFTVDLNELHVENLSEVIGIKCVEFYITQVGDNSNTASNTDVAKFVDVVTDDIPSVAQIHDARNGMLFMRVPLERHYSGSNGILVREKQWKPHQRVQNFFMPTALRQIRFRVYEFQDDGDYRLLQPDARFHMILEITTRDHKQKPKSKEAQILNALERLNVKIDELNSNVRRLPDKPTHKGKRPATTLYAIVAAAVLAFIAWVNFGRRVAIAS
jgi:hypothetical protein